MLHQQLKAPLLPCPKTLVPRCDYHNDRFVSCDLAESHRDYISISPQSAKGSIKLRNKQFASKASSSGKVRVPA